MGTNFQPREAARYKEALRRFDEVNSHDPNKTMSSEGLKPCELAYAEWLTDWVLRICPEASEELRLAARSQHLCRWQVPRQSYPMTRTGYLQWRESLKKFHAEKAGEILREVGYPPETVARVQSLNLKKNLAQDHETQVLEDALCLVFLQYQFAALAAKTPEEKMLGVIQKTWKKMSPAGQNAAAALAFGPKEKALFDRVLNSIQ
jgi:hypothetical protein